MSDKTITKKHSKKNSKTSENKTEGAKPVKTKRSERKPYSKKASATTKAPVTKSKTTKGQRSGKSIDPHSERESLKYDKPIASREFILELLKSADSLQVLGDIAEQLDIDQDEDKLLALKRRLRAMVREGQIIQNRKGAYGLVAKMDLTRGRISANAAGFGFLIPDEGGEDLFLSPGQMKALFDGDVALASVSGIDRRGRKEGKIVEVIERNTQEIVGRCFNESGVIFVSPENKKVCLDVVIGEKPQQKVKDGQFVVVEIIQQPSYRSPPLGKIIEILGDHMAPGMEVDVAIRSHQIPNTWPDAIAGELKAIPLSVNNEEAVARVDLRALNFVTIDGEDARDFDDAVCCEKNKTGGWTLFVAIADVANYVEASTALDVEAYNRGNSVYFPSQVIPMLPEQLSNGLCSLNPKLDRLTLACEMQVSEQGEVTNYQFMEATIHSKARLTYTQVGAFLEKAELCPEIESLQKDLLALQDVYTVFRQQREKRGAIDFETVESRFVYNDEMKIEGVVPVHRNVAHKIIEEAMLSANVCAAEFLNKHQLPALYRVHEPPSEDKISDLLDFVAPLGLRLKAGKDIESRHFQEIAEFAKGRGDEEIITTVLLRSMRQAWYSEECAQHFGLAYQAYAHFTSPIRRYPDLIVHRAIKYFVNSKPDSKYVRGNNKPAKLERNNYLVSNEALLHEKGLHLSDTERRADLATRDAMDWLKCEFMLDKVGETFKGKISTVTGFGLFVTLDEVFVEGLVHISELKNDYYHYDSLHHELKGEHSDRAFRLSDEIEIVVARVDLDDRKIEFVLAGDAGEDKRPPGRKPRSDKSGSDKKRGDKSRNGTNKTTSNKTNKNKPKDSAKKSKKKKKASVANKKSKMKAAAKKNEKPPSKKEAAKKKRKKANAKRRAKD